jgi:glyoxylate/hydroxypyruvate/2-ketogluconate reductase
MGRIGQAIAKRAAFGFGMKIVYHNRSRLDPATEQSCQAVYATKADLLAAADHVILTLPYTPPGPPPPTTQSLPTTCP